MIDITLGADAWKDIDPGIEALVDKWLVAEGDAVSAGQTLAHVVLVKTTMDIVAPTKGLIEKILVQAGETFAQGKPIARLREVT